MVFAHVGNVNEQMTHPSKWTHRVRTRRQKKSASDRASLKFQAQKHGSVAIAGLVQIMRTCESDSLRVLAINMLLDRGYGKPPHSLDEAVADAIPLPEMRDDMSLQEMQAAYREIRNMPIQLLRRRFAATAHAPGAKGYIKALAERCGL